MQETNYREVVGLFLQEKNRIKIKNGRGEYARYEEKT
jgi:hypothetical protein